MVRCEDVQAHLADHLAGALPPAVAAGVEAHLRSCPACAGEFESAGDTWQRLVLLQGPRPDSTAMRARFDDALADYQRVSTPRRRPPLVHYGLQAAAAAAILVAGVAIGRTTVPDPGPDPQIGEMRAELRDMRHMVTLSLLQQRSASDRLKGVTFTNQIDRPGTDIAAALLDMLKHDANVNVRLATIDALKRFADDEAVRRGTVETLPEQTPLVQIALIDFLVETNRRDAAGTLRQLSMDSMVDAAVRARAEQGLLRLG